MKRLIAVFILLLGINFCFAQQNLFFEEIRDSHYQPAIKKYSLPQSVTCTFKDGTKKRLMLENVQGDTLFFRKYYNQAGNACLYSSLEKIKIHKEGEVLTGILCAGFSGTAIFLVTIATIANHPPTDASDPSQFISHVFAMASIIPITGAIITAVSFPKSYKLNKWKMYVK